ncbi:MAG: DJ-1/PfpI family protein [Bacteroidetes bacterium]|nr:DJ-1/PfpI family protein [Bacteroidota bacterium]
MASKMNVAVLFYPGVEMIDMNGPLDVFVKANRYNNDRYKIYTLAEKSGETDSERAVVRMIPDYTFDDCPPPDIIVIPGQIMPAGSANQFGSGSDGLIAWLQQQATRDGVVIMSVCVGAYIFAKTGLLSGRDATTHWLALEAMQKQYPDITFIKNVRFVADRNYITTGGVTSGIDGALYLISVLDGPELAKTVADIMVYNREAPLPPGTILPPVAS